MKVAILSKIYDRTEMKQTIFRTHNIAKAMIITGNEEQNKKENERKDRFKCHFRFIRKSPPS